jgi:hypothetical protein
LLAGFRICTLLHIRWFTLSPRHSFIPHTAKHALLPHALLPHALLPHAHYTTALQQPSQEYNMKLYNNTASQGSTNARGRGYNSSSSWSLRQSAKSSSNCEYGIYGCRNKSHPFQTFFQLITSELRLFGYWRWPTELPRSVRSASVWRYPTAPQREDILEDLAYTHSTLRCLSDQHKWNSQGAHTQRDASISEAGKHGCATDELQFIASPSHRYRLTEPRWQKMNHK